MLKKLCIITLCLTGLCSAQLIDENVMPFGFYSSRSPANQTYFSDADLDSMHNLLGINQHMSGGFSAVQVNRFYADSIYVYPWSTAGDGDDEQTMYAECQYFVCQPEDTSWNTRFYYWNLDSGYPDRDSSFVAYSGSEIMLDSLCFYHPNKYAILDPEDFQIRYYPLLGIKIDTAGFAGDSLVGVFKVKRVYPNASELFLDSIWFSDLRDTLGNLPTDFIELVLISDLDSSPFFHAREIDTTSGGGWIKYSLETVGNCTVYIDYFKVHCQNGQELMDGDHNSEIIASISREAFEDKILGWFLKDSEYPGNYYPYAKIDSLVRYASGWDNPVYGASWAIPSGIFHSFGKTYRDFTRIIKPKILWAYLYPVYESDYTGFCYADSELAWHEGTNQYPYTSWETAADSIQKAIVVAEAGDTVIHDATQDSFGTAIDGVSIHSGCFNIGEYHHGVSKDDCLR